MKLAQLTDLHLFADPAAVFLGHDVYAGLRRVVSALAAAKPDAVLLTGDISQDMSEASYHWAAQALAAFDAPVHWIPGNHDSPATVASVFAGYSFLHRLDELSWPGWTLLAVDTILPGNQDEGLIAPDALAVLRVRLQNATAPNLALAMHHHPLAVGTPLLDVCMLQQSEAFWSSVQDIPALKLAICGHVHGEHSLARGSVALEVCPAACFQWRKGTSTVDTENRQGGRLFTFGIQGYDVATIYA
ncbi:metallophosphoesterase [Chromobacterium sp. IIBBL 290-4]|uniref:metallophosphoesterase n=1 Tax=Chromobacterium sp. IIBBL 290-4 TaxID=2953890 RepID=UPI0020B80A28|nr:metallophosphoesterase [Chromobacterium sp. IIBBL 290-4]UTH75272.1 metallophosphoesterase [Chromobacterium sp. IIBBL 290-4]